MSSVTFAVHDANTVGFIGFFNITTLAYAVTILTLAISQISSAVQSSVGARIGFGAAWLAALVVGALVTYFITQLLGFFFFTPFFESLF